MGSDRYAPPTVLEALWDHELKNGNLHRVQVVRYGRAPRALVLLEVRELIRPELVARARPVPDVFMPGPDGEAWGLGRMKALRIDHLEWILANGDQVLAAMKAGKADTIMEGVDAFAGRPQTSREPEA